MNTRRKFLALVLGLCVGSLAAEGVLRVLLFSDARWVRDHTWSLRQAERFFDASSDDDYWKLQRTIETRTGEVAAPWVHPELGWIGPGIDPRSLHSTQLPHESDPRRPVALYGCSFARCMTPSEQCFEGCLERSPLGARYMLANYGVRGYGIDQIYMLLACTLDELARRKAVVIVGVLIDDDFDRAVLRLRGSPKPRFVLQGGVLALERERVPTIDEFLRDHPLRFGSYLGLGLSRMLGSRPDAALWAEKRELGAALLREICATLRAREVEFFFVLFFGQESWRDAARAGWREELALETLRAERARCVSTRGPLARFAAEHSGSADACFVLGGQADGHYTALGNEVAFEALRAGLEGRFDE